MLNPPQAGRRCSSTGGVNKAAAECLGIGVNWGSESGQAGKLFLEGPWNTVKGVGSGTGSGKPSLNSEGRSDLNSAAEGGV